MAIAATRSITRRDLLRGRADPDAAAGVIRPPWSTEETVSAHCSSCGRCADACPENVIVIDQGGRPGVAFGTAECTFCGACAAACPEPVFATFDETPWHLRAEIGTECLLNRAVLCRGCADACETQALRYDMRGGPVGTLHLVPSDCTGCGACAAVCPVGAIHLVIDDASKEGDRRDG